MKKVFLIHGFQGSPNGGWRPWLMGELEKKGICACAFAMPDPNNPVPEEWFQEIARHVDSSPRDSVYLVGHSLGVPPILRFLETTRANIVVIHGSDDRAVSSDQGEALAEALSGKLIMIKNGGHLNGSSGWLKLPQCLASLSKMMK